MYALNVTVSAFPRLGSVRLALADVGCLWGVRTEVVAGQAFPLVTGLQPRDCKAIAKASKVRILCQAGSGALSPASSSPVAKSGYGWHALAVAESHVNRTAHPKRSVPLSVCAGQRHNSIGSGSRFQCLSGSWTPHASKCGVFCLPTDCSSQACPLRGGYRELCAASCVRGSTRIPLPWTQTPSIAGQRRRTLAQRSIGAHSQ
jgi:hypothetical protein